MRWSQLSLDKPTTWSWFTSVNWHPRTAPLLLAVREATGWRRPRRRWWEESRSHRSPPQTGVRTRCYRRSVPTAGWRSWVGVRSCWFWCCDPESRRGPWGAPCCWCCSYDCRPGDKRTLWVNDTARANPSKQALQSLNNCLHSYLHEQLNMLKHLQSCWCETMTSAQPDTFKHFKQESLTLDCCHFATRQSS